MLSKLFLRIKNTVKKSDEYIESYNFCLGKGSS